MEVQGNIFDTIENLTFLNFLDSARCFVPNSGFSINPDQPELDTNDIAVVQFNNLSFNANQFQWNFGDGAQSPESNPQHIFTEAGTYEIELIACNTNCLPAECDTSQSTIQVSDINVATTSVSGYESVNLFPNPASQTLYFTLPSSLNTLPRLQLLSYNGLLLDQLTIDEAVGSIDVLHFTPGLYFARFVWKDFQITRLFIRAE
jgi:hypothetical protein